MSFTHPALMELHVEALYRHTPGGRLVETREAEPEPAPRFFLGRTTSGHLWRFRNDLPAPLARSLDIVAAAEPVLPDLPREPTCFSRVRNLLQEHAEIRQTWLGPAYSFPEDVPSPPGVLRITDESCRLLGEEYAWLQTDRAAYEPVLAARVGERIVSIAFSSRVSGRAAEAGVDTLPAFRGQGYASRVVAAWAIAVREMGRVPLYSTSWGNLASRGVARRLGLRLYGVDLSVS